MLSKYQILLKITVLSCFQLVTNDIGATETSADLFQELKSSVIIAQEALDKLALDSLGDLIITLGEETNDKDILHFGFYAKSNGKSRNDPSVAITYGVRAQSYYDEIDDGFLWSRVTNILASSYSNRGEHRKSLQLYSDVIDRLKSLENANSPESKRYISRVAYNAGFTAVKLGDLDRSVNFLSEADKVAREGKDTLLQLSILVQYGNINIYRETPKEALKHYKEAYALASLFGTRFMTSPMFGIGAAYLEMEELDSALVYNLKVLEIYRKSNKKTSLCATLCNCAEIYINLGNPEEAITMANELLSYGKEMEANQHILNAVHALARAYYELGDLHKARSYIADYEGHFDEDTEFDIAKDYYKLATTIAENQKDYRAAFEYQTKYKSYSDSLLNRESLAAVDELEIKLETEKKDQKIESLESEQRLNELTSQRNAIVIGTIGAFIILSLIIASMYINRRRRELVNKKDQIEQKLLRSQMNPHFIFNAISSIQNYLYDKSDLKIALTYMSQFGELMRQILENSREEFVQLSEEIKTLKNYLELQQLRYNNSFGFEFEIDDDIDINELMVPPLIAQPFVENSIEHGMIYRVENGLVRIRFAYKDGKLEITIEDNGVGSKSMEIASNQIEQKKKSLATIITKERLEYLSKLNKKNFHLAARALQEGGTLITIHLPIINAA